MKKSAFLIILFSSFLFFSCSINDVTENQQGLSFYLLKDSTLSPNKIAVDSMNINNLSLAKTSLLTDKNIIRYVWSEHSFSVDSSGVSVLNKIISSIHNIQGIPFVITVNKERIYIGAFWPIISSAVPLVPFIAQRSHDNNYKTITINKARGIVKTDFRNDRRIYNVLKENDKLIE